MPHRKSASAATAVRTAPPSLTVSYAAAICAAIGMASVTGTAAAARGTGRRSGGDGGLGRGQRARRVGAGADGDARVDLRLEDVLPERHEGHRRGGLGGGAELVVGHDADDADLDAAQREDAAERRRIAEE